ncbi:hypothetical protein Fot_14629 [Forsythia ovata]|uniref:Uncharacterized protein n=1 Tax=Forsythia ovata TaxID=205694 RepID=A0ABD1W6W1_9LAMI
MELGHPLVRVGIVTKSIKDTSGPCGSTLSLFEQVNGLITSGVSCFTIGTRVTCCWGPSFGFTQFFILGFIASYFTSLFAVKNSKVKGSYGHNLLYPVILDRSPLCVVRRFRPRFLGKILEVVFEVEIDLDYFSFLEVFGQISLNGHRELSVRPPTSNDGSHRSDAHNLYETSNTPLSGTETAHEGASVLRSILEKIVEDQNGVRETLMYDRRVYESLCIVDFLHKALLAFISSILAGVLNSLVAGVERARGCDKFKGYTYSYQ